MGNGALFYQPGQHAQSTNRWIPRSTAYTFFSGNGSLGEGAVNPPYSGYPEGSVYDSVGNQVLFGDGFGFNISALNGTTGAVAGLRYLPTLPGHWSEFSLPEYFAYNPRANIVYVGEVGTDAVSFLNGTTDAVIRTVRVTNGGPTALAFDPHSGDLFVGSAPNISVLDGVSGAFIANVPDTPNQYPYAMVYDPLGHNIWSAEGTAASTSPIDVINDTTFKVSRQVQLPEGDVAALTYDSTNGEIFATGSGVAGVGWAAAMNASPSATSPVISTTALSWPGYYLTFNPDTNEVYVGASSWLYVIDATNDSLLRSVPISVATLTYNPRDHLLFLIDPTNYTVALIDGWNDSILRFVPVYVTYLTGALDPDNGDVYIATPSACASQGMVTILQPGPSPRVLGTLPSGDGPSGVAYDPTDHRVFVTNYCSNNLTVIDSSSNTVVNRSLPVGSEPYGVAFDSLHDALFVANYLSHNVTELNASSFAPIHTYPLPNGSCPYAVSVVPGLEQVYVTNACGGNISILNASTQTVIVAQLATGFSSQGVVYDDQNHLVYVANTDANTISYIAVTNHTVLGNVTVSNGPTALAFDPDDQLLFAADAVGSRVSVVDTLRNVRTGPTFPASANRVGIVYVAASHQVDLFASGTGAINILANTPTIRSVLLNPSPSGVGVPTTVGVVAQNGTGAYSYNYSGLPPGCPPTDAPVLLCSPTAAGNFEMTVTVTDSVGYTWWSTINFTVAGPVVLAAFTIQPGVVDLGGTLHLYSVANGGASPLNYSYYGLPPRCASTDAANLTCVPSAFGTYVVTVVVSDRLGRTQNRTAVVTVNPQLEMLGFSATANPVVAGDATTLELLVAGGTSPLSFAYSGLPTGCASTNLSKLPCTPSAVNNYTVTATATDGLGHQVSAVLLLTVNPAPRPGPLVPSISYGVEASCKNNVETASVQLFASATGGAAPYAYSWVLPSGAISGSSATTSLVAGGNTTVSLSVADSNGAVSTESERIPIAGMTCATSAAPPSSSAVERVGWLLVGAAIGAGFAALVLWRYGRRSRVQPPSGDAPLGE